MNSQALARAFIPSARMAVRADTLFSTTPVQLKSSVIEPAQLFASQLIFFEFFPGRRAAMPPMIFNARCPDDLQRTPKGISTKAVPSNNRVRTKFYRLR